MSNEAASAVVDLVNAAHQTPSEAVEQLKKDEKTAALGNAVARVKAGDTVARVAEKQDAPGSGYQKLQELNRQYVPSPDFIVVGQKL